LYNPRAEKEEHNAWDTNLPASRVNVFGHVIGDASPLGSVPDGERVTIERTAEV
jgi:hypothetical protein